MNKCIVLIAGMALALPGAGAQTLNGAGATFPFPVYERWFHSFHQLSPGRQVNYQSVGSGMGITQLTAGLVDFGASDMPMKDDQIAALKVHVLHFPTVLGSVAIVYNLPEVPQRGMRFTAEVLAGIFAGKITRWNDPRIASLNPGVAMPAREIIAVHRSDSSGTTFVFSDYLSKVVPEWGSSIGKGTTVSWPAGVSEKGSDGIAAQVKRSLGAIGYVELTYALENKLSYGSIRNSSGNFVRPEVASVTAAASSAARNMSPDFRVSITDAPGAGAYPISSYTWWLVPESFADAGKRKAMIALLRWMLTEGQKECTDPGYSPLPREVVQREEQQIQRIH
jgi:phosphate transport system substrate-binding protein